MNNNEIISFLTVLLGIMIGVLVILCLVFLFLKFKSTVKSASKEKRDNKNNKKSRIDVTKNKVSSVKEYSKESIFKFMEFDKIEDNMIVQNNGKRFLMVIECQGVNYDLMSGLEKNSVEQGFVQFLNTLRYPIQLYVQTRTVNLGGSVNTYKEKVDEVSRELANKKMEYNQKVRSGQYTEQQLQKEKFELVRLKNLYEYTVDIINNTERMSLNKNILRKHYYVVIPHFSEEASDSAYTQDEVSSLAFSELYTKAQAIISSLMVCGINCKVLNSVELAELLYVAYNRDEAETMDLARTLNAGYEDLYTTAPNVLDKRMRELELKAEEEAIIRANEAIFGAVEENEKERIVKKKEKELSKLIDEMAIALINDNKKAVGEDVAEKAIEKVKRGRPRKTKDEGGEDNEQEAKKTIRSARNSI